MAWYRSGTLSVTNSSTSVTGAGTSWIAGAGIGEALYAPDGRIYEIANISSNTSLTLATAYLGTTQSAQSYTIIPSQSYIRDLAADAAALISQYAGIASGAGAGKFTDGTVSTPGIAFASDVDTGIYHPATNTLGIAAGGINQMQVGTAGVNIGTLSANPVISAGTANGVTYLNASKQLTSGSALTFDGTNLGIGVTPTSKLDILGPGNNGGVNTDLTARVLSANSAAGLGLNFNSIWSIGTSQPLIFGTEASERMRLTSTGLGIGTSSPGYKLDVAGTLNVVNGSNGRINIGAPSNYLYGDSTGNLIIGTSGSDKLQVDAAGNLGLGVTPSAWIGNRKTLQIGGLAIANINYTSSIGENTYNFYYNNNGSTIYQNNGPAAAFDFNNSASGGFAWKTAPSGTAGQPSSFTQAMTLDASGNLGIGETAPQSRLAVYGDIAVGLNSENRGINIGPVGSSARINYNVNGNLEIAPRSGYSIVFFGSASGAERARIDSSGNLGVGTTSALNSSRITAWTPYASPVALTLHRPSTDVTGGVAMCFSQYNSSLAAANYASVVGVVSSNTAGSHSGALVFETARSGTLTEAGRFDASGSLLVGTVNTNLTNGGVFLVPGVNSEVGIGHASGAISGSTFCNFRHANVPIGSITQNGTTAVSYNTSSDYRLKNITGPVSNSGAYIDSLNPVEGTWKADGSTFVGLIAHEVQEASRTQVATGEKDGEQMQAMDYSNSELIANLIAEVKSLRARVAALETN